MLLPSLALAAAVLAALSGCGAYSARPAPDAGSVPWDAGSDRGNDAALDASSGTDAASDAPSDAPSADGAPLDAGSDVHECHVNRDCREWWSKGQAFCDLGTCCNGRIDRFGCVCGELRGGCPAGDYWCCDDWLHPEIPVGCSDRPCE